MGCSFDKLGATITKKENVETFVEIYNRELAEQFYWGEDDFIDESSFEYHKGIGYILGVDAEPLFKRMENGAQFAAVVHAYIEAVPDCDFTAWYECTFNNCGAIVSTEYVYRDGVLTVVDKDSEESDLSYCPECDWDAYEDEDGEPLCTIDDWEEGKEFVCPNCGETLEWDVSVTKTVYNLVDCKLVIDKEV